MLPDAGTCTYNGVNIAEMIRSHVEARPVRDGARRVRVATEYAIEVDGVIAAATGGTTDTTLASLRELLLQPAAPLVFQKKGYGDLVVNTAGGTWDCAWGPWPDLLDCTIYGNGQSARVKLRIVVTVPCEQKKQPLPEGVIEWNFSEDWDIDDDGYTKRVISGQLVIGLTRPQPSARTVVDDANNYREKVVPLPVPLGFRRMQHFGTSPDRRTLKYTITDEEIPVPLPPGVSRAEVRQRIAWAREANFKLLRGTISGTLTVPAGQPKSLIWSKIGLIVGSRLSPNLVQGAQNGGPLDGSVAALSQPAGVLFLDSVEVEDDLFGRSSSFSVGYSMMGASLSSLLSGSGMWTPVPQAGWATWRTSLQASAMSPRGAAKLASSLDALVDLCGGQQPPTSGNTSKGKPPPPTARGILRQTSRPPGAQGVPNARGIPGVPANRSWLWYWCRIWLIEDDRVARHKPLKQPSPPRPVQPLEGFIAQVRGGGGGQLQGTTTLKGATGAPGPGVRSGTPDLLQQVGGPSYRILLQGRGVRLGYPVPIPRIQSVGGIPLTQSRQAVGQDQVTSVGGIPVYQSIWDVEYELPDDPQGDLPLPLNPALA